MAFDLSDCRFSGPALPEPFIRFDLEKELQRLDLLPKTGGEQARDLEQFWAAYRRRLRELVLRGGAVRVYNHVLEPLQRGLGYDHAEDAAEVETREGRESGGTLLLSADGQRACVPGAWRSRKTWTPRRAAAPPIDSATCTSPSASCWREARHSGY